MVVTSMVRQAAAYHHGMETSAEIRDRWRSLRELLIEQLGRFESDILQMQTAGVDVSPDVIARLKKEILEFDGMIARNESRDA